MSLREERMAMIDLVQKWKLKYDGGKDVLKFVDRLEELAGMYEINLNGVVPVMCELLKDRALIWFRNNHKAWQQWSQLKKDLLDFFLPYLYFEKLEAEIRSRTQRPHENFKDYVLALQDLMYHSKMSVSEKLDRIFRNSSPDYQWCIKRRDFNTLDDLLSLVAELESIPTSRNTGQSEHHRMLKDKHPSPVRTNKMNNQLTCLLWEGEKIKATLLINDRPTTAIVDTRATRCLVTISFLQQMRLTPKYLPKDIKDSLAKGSRKHSSNVLRCGSR